MTDEEKQGEVSEPEEIAAEDSVGAQETPTERQQEREQAIVDEPVAESEQRIAEAALPAEPAAAEEDEEFVEETPRIKPEIPGMDLEVDIVREGEETFREDEDAYGEADGDSAEEEFSQPIAHAAIDLAAGARYTATGKRKTAVARVILQPGTGAYKINGRTLRACQAQAQLRVPALVRPLEGHAQVIALGFQRRVQGYFTSPIGTDLFKTVYLGGQ